MLIKVNNGCFSSDNGCAVAGSRPPVYNPKADDTFPTSPRHLGANSNVYPRNTQNTEDKNWNWDNLIFFSKREATNAYYVACVSVGQVPASSRTTSMPYARNASVPDYIYIYVCFSGMLLPLLLLTTCCYTCNCCFCFWCRCCCCCSVLFYSILFYSILFYSILFYSIHCNAGI